MNDADDLDISKLDPQEREFFDKIKGLTDNAFEMGYMAGVNSILGDDDEEIDGRKVKRVMVTKGGLLAFLIIVLGSTFSLGMYIGGLNG
jgi:hypothetical protein